MVVDTLKGTLCLMNPTSQHGSEHTFKGTLHRNMVLSTPAGTLRYRVLGVTKLLKVEEPRFAFRLRKAEPGSAPFGTSPSASLPSLAKKKQCFGVAL